MAAKISSRVFVADFFGFACKTNTKEAAGKAAMSCFDPLSHEMHTQSQSQSWLRTKELRSSSLDFSSSLGVTLLGVTVLGVTSLGVGVTSLAIAWLLLLAGDSRVFDAT